MKKEEKKDVNPANHLAGVHTGDVKSPQLEEKKIEPKVEQTNSNHLASVHTGEVKIEKEVGENRNHHNQGKVEVSDTELGEVPEVLPTELGGHPVVNEDDGTEKKSEGDSLTGSEDKQ